MHSCQYFTNYVMTLSDQLINGTEEGSFTNSSVNFRIHLKIFTYQE